MQIAIDPTETIAQLIKILEILELEHIAMSL